MTSPTLRISGRRIATVVDSSSVAVDVDPGEVVSIREPDRQPGQTSHNYRTRR